MRALDSGSDSDRKRSRSRSRSPAKFREGDKVEARLSGQSKWSKAKVRRVRDDTYDLEFDDGEREKRVKPKYIRKRGGSRGGSYATTLLCCRVPVWRPCRAGPALNCIGCWSHGSGASRRRMPAWPIAARAATAY